MLQQYWIKTSAIYNNNSHNKYYYDYYYYCVCCCCCNINMMFPGYIVFPYSKLDFLSLAKTPIKIMLICTHVNFSWKRLFPYYKFIFLDYYRSISHLICVTGFITIMHFVIVELCHINWFWTVLSLVHNMSTVWLQFHSFCLLFFSVWCVTCKCCSKAWTSILRCDIPVVCRLQCRNKYVGPS